MYNISKIKHSSLLRHFLRMVKFSWRLEGLTLCSSLRCFPITECLCSSTSWCRWRHIDTKYSQTWNIFFPDVWHGLKSLPVQLNFYFNWHIFDPFIKRATNPGPSLITHLLVQHDCQSINQSINQFYLLPINSGLQSHCYYCQ